MWTETLWTTFGGRCVLSTALFVTGLLAWWRWPRTWTPRAQWALLLGLAITARALVWPLPVSDDVNRYIWEGRLVRLGLSPYTAPADAPQFAAFHDAEWAAMNHKDKLTVYPPLAELVFAALGNSPWMHKLAFTLAELAVLPFLAALGGPSRFRWLVLYAVNPVPVLSFAGEAHFDSLMVLASVAAVWAWERGRFAWAWALLGIAVQMKIVAVFLAWPFWAQGNARSRCGIVAFGAVMILPVLPFATTLPNLIRGITSFAGDTSGNGFLHWLLELLFRGKVVPGILLACLFIALVFVIGRKVRPMSRAAMLIFGAFVLCAPTVTFWYPTWGLPFATLHPCIPFWVLSALDVLYFAAWQKHELTGNWEHPWWAYWALWTPVFLTLAVWLRRYSLSGIHSDSSGPRRVAPPQQ